MPLNSPERMKSALCWLFRGFFHLDLEQSGVVSPSQLSADPSRDTFRRGQTPLERSLENIRTNALFAPQA